ncbi:MAG: PDZ domain-containing protein [Chthoniobacter sp.]|uniref:S1C family serine protease n=1 Tax=Chthoniobacter sp. TaxID=2510640 RepID=UPI0032A4516B
MKTAPQFLLAAALALGASLAVAQDDQKPAPPPAAPAPDAANRPTEPNPQKPSPPPPTPGHDGRHHGGPRPPEDGRHGDAPPSHPEGGDGRPDGWRRPSGWQGPPPSKPTSYIGVITTPPPSVLTAQLGLADGFGLVVSDVLPDSPAAKAGVQRNDVLTKFNDQQLVDSGQFSTLVRALKKGTEASITLLRKAQEQTLKVTIDERALPERRPLPGPGGYPGQEYRRMQGDSGNSGAPVQEFARRLQEQGARIQEETDRQQERMKAYDKKMQEYQERMKIWQKDQTGEPPEHPGAPPTPDIRSFQIPKLPRLPSQTAPAPISPEDILREVRPGGVAQIRLLQPDGSVTYNMANARLVMKDDTGEVEMTMHDGKRSLVARNAQGETVFDGPIDTEEQRKALPEDVRKKIEMIEVQKNMAQMRAQAADPVLLNDVQ